MFAPIVNAEASKENAGATSWYEQSSPNAPTDSSQRFGFLSEMWEASWRFAHIGLCVCM